MDLVKKHVLYVILPENQVNLHPVGMPQLIHLNMLSETVITGAPSVSDKSSVTSKLIVHYNFSVNWQSCESQLTECQLTDECQLTVTLMLPDRHVNVSWLSVPVPHHRRQIPQTARPSLPGTNDLSTVASESDLHVPPVIKDKIYVKGIFYAMKRLLIKIFQRFLGITFSLFKKWWPNEAVSRVPVQCQNVAI